MILGANGKAYPTRYGEITARRLKSFGKLFEKYSEPPKYEGIFKPILFDHRGNLINLNQGTVKFKRYGKFSL